MADYSTSTPLTTDTGLVYGLVGVGNTNNPILFEPGNVGNSTLTFTAPAGFSVVGSPLTGTGTISLGFSAGYSLPTTASQTNWNTAYSWGDHAAAGYLASGDIGSTVLAYDANLQAFTTALTLPTTDGTAGQTLKTDGAGTVSFADTVTNGQIINGTAFFVTDTKPTTRIGGGALVDGDQWTKPTDNGVAGTAGNWVYKSAISDWVSNTLYTTEIDLFNPVFIGSHITRLVNRTTPIIGSFNIFAEIFTLNTVAVFNFGDATTATMDVGLAAPLLPLSSGGITLLSGVDIFSSPPPAGFSNDYTVNAVATITNSARNLQIEFTLNNTTAADFGNLTASMTYRLIHP